MSENIKVQEYLMLREEIQSNLKSQQSLSTFSITAVLTIIGIAANMELTALYLLPVIVLLLAAVKTRNYRLNMMKIAAYMIARDESSDGFYWETSLNKYREKEHKDKKFFKRIRYVLISFLETQEFFFMGSICLIIYIVQSIRAGLTCSYDKIEFFILISLTIIALLLIVIISNDYWNLDPDTVNEEKEKWEKIFKGPDTKPENKK